MGTGRKPKPTQLKVVTGNPGRRPLNECEPVASSVRPVAPDWLDTEAAMEWSRVTVLLDEIGMLSQTDAAALEAYCVCYGRWKDAERKVVEGGMIVRGAKDQPIKSPWLRVAETALADMRKLLAEFGLTPSSRSRLVAEPRKRPDSVEDFAKSKYGG